MSRDRPILHIVERARWAEALRAGIYRADSLETEGFIHCSEPAQVIRVANARFRSRRDLVLLCIDPARVEPEIVRENTEGGEELFPHVYGPLNLDAVLRVLDLPPDGSGEFELPAELA